MTGEYTLVVPAPTQFINLNQRLHWAARAKLTKGWRNAAHIYARQANLPKGLGRVQITAHISKSTAHQYDAHNLIPTVKAIIDGLVDYGLVPDDTNAHVIGPDMREGPRGVAGVTLTITKLSP